MLRQPGDPHGVPQGYRPGVDQQTTQHVFLMQQPQQQMSPRPAAAVADPRQGPGAELHGVPRQ